MVNKKVSVYSTPTCHYCKEAKDFFKSNQIDFDEYDVSKDMDKRKEMFEKSGKMSVPIITIGDKTFVGFGDDSKKEIISLLEIKNNE
jgi:glutaredoxin 3